MVKVLERDNVIKEERMPDNKEFDFIYALPNRLPYNKLLFDHKLSAKTREWKWKHTGLTLLYTSTRTVSPVMQAHGLKKKDYKHLLGTIEGVGFLQPVRPCSRREVMRIEREFGNGRTTLPYIEAGFYLYKFKDLQRFTEPISFKPPSGAVKVIRVPKIVVAEALQNIGIAT